MVSTYWQREYLANLAARQGLVVAQGLQHALAESVGLHGRRDGLEAALQVAGD